MNQADKDGKKAVYPTDEELQKAKGLLDLYRKGEGSLWSRVIEQGYRCGLKLNQWIEEQLEIKNKFSKSITEKWGTFLKRTVEGNPLHLTDRDNHSSFQNELDRIEVGLNIIDQYLIFDPNPENNLHGLSWNAYFLYYPKNNSLGDNVEAMLGRAIVSVNDGRKYPVHFANTDRTRSVDYKAKQYDAQIKELDPGLITLDLESGKNGRLLHIKLFCKNKDQKIMLGQFTTYEDSRIQSGTILFQRRADNSTVQPGLFSAFENPEEFGDKDKIPPQIRAFFALKNKNYHRVYGNVHDLDSLQAALKNDDPQLYKDSWFLEKPQPGLFIASPIQTSTSYDESFLETVEKQLQTDLDKFKVRFNRKDEGNDDEGNPQPIENLRELKTQRVFVLLIEKIDYPSYSLVQLGFALNYCKLVIVVHKKGHMSKRILGFKKHVMYTIPYTGTLPDAWNGREGVREKLVQYIKEKSPKALGGRLG